MRRQSLLLILGALGLAASACVSEADAVRDRADEIEKTYGLAPAEARVAAREHPVLGTPETRSLFQRTAEPLGMKALAPDDVPAFVALAEAPDAQREAVALSLQSPELLTFVANLRKTFGYEARYRERDLLIEMSRNPSKHSAAFAEGVRDAVELIRQRAPRARFPLAAIDTAALLGGVRPARVASTLDRFQRLEIDLGTHELSPPALLLLVHAAKDQGESDALSALVRNLPSLQLARLDPEALRSVASIPSSSLAVILDRLGPTRTWRNFVGFNGAAAAYLKELSARPPAAAIVGLLEEASDRFQCTGELEEARRLIKIDAAAPEGQAREALASVFRARVALDRLDDAATELLVALVGKPELRDAVKALSSAFGQWRPTASELPVLQTLAGVPNLGPTARSLRTLGYELADRPITKSEGTSLAELAKADAHRLIDGLHIVLPRLAVKDAAALGELAALAKAGVTYEDVLRLDADSIVGALDPIKRARIVEKVKKAG